MKKKNHVAHVSFRKLGRERAYGVCDYVKKKITIDPRQKPKLMLDTLIHETLHWLEPEWSESKVSRVSRQLSRIVWQFNFRQLRE